MSEFAFAAGASSPRKRPVQERSQHTVSAILEATIQVLEKDGASLTTTRVAEVAGVSVGTLYQYFPNREALMNGVFAAHLEAAILAIEEAAATAKDMAFADAAAHVVRAFLAAKAAQAPVSKVLNHVFGIGMLDERPFVQAAIQRAREAVANMLAGGAPDPETLQRIGIVCNAVQGVVHAAAHEDPDRMTDPAWVEQVVALAVAGASKGSAKIPGV